MENILFAKRTPLAIPQPAYVKMVLKTTQVMVTGSTITYVDELTRVTIILVIIPLHVRLMGTLLNVFVITIIPLTKMTERGSTPCTLTRHFLIIKMPQLYAQRHYHAC